MMMHGRNNGKKLMTMRILKHAFEIIHLMTSERADELRNKLKNYLQAAQAAKE